MEKTTHIIRGIGSVLNIAPATDYAHFIPKGTTNERMRRILERTGRHFEIAVRRFDDEHKKETKKA
jgi:hypothetical protein